MQKFNTFYGYKFEKPNRMTFGEGNTLIVDREHLSGFFDHISTYRPGRDVMISNPFPINESEEDDFGWAEEIPDKPLSLQCEDLEPGMMVLMRSVRPAGS